MEEVAPQSFGLLALARRGGVSAIERTCAVAGTVDGEHQIGQRGTRRSRDVRALGCEIDRRMAHAGDGGQRPLDTPGAGGAGHALDFQVELPLRHLVTSPFDRLNQVSGRHPASVKGNLGLLGRKVDGGIGHAWHGPERALHPSRAGGAGHADHGKRPTRQRGRGGNEAHAPIWVCRHGEGQDAAGRAPRPADALP